jgi:hypothetical protein
MPKAEAEANVERFNTWFNQQPAETQAMYSGGSRIENYQHCQFCGGTEFIPAMEDDAPIGCTLSPIIWEPEGT